MHGSHWAEVLRIRPQFSVLSTEDSRKIYSPRPQCAFASRPNVKQGTSSSRRPVHLFTDNSSRETRITCTGLADGQLVRLLMYVWRVYDHVRLLQLISTY